VHAYEKWESQKNSEDLLSVTSVGSKFYTPTRAKDLAPIVPLNPNARKPAYLNHLYYKEDQKFFEYAKYNE
jgi:hypothetical protein